MSFELGVMRLVGPGPNRAVPSAEITVQVFSKVLQKKPNDNDQRPVKKEPLVFSHDDRRRRHTI